MQNSLGRRTSNPNNGQLKDTQIRLGFTEPTATIVWGEIIKNRIPPEQVVTWNIFPFHPFKQDQNSQALLRLCPDVSVISIGALSSKTLDKLGIQNIHVPHPANGGAGRFRVATKSVFFTRL